MTNRDVINGMTNEELGRFLDRISCSNCVYYEAHGVGSPDICTKDSFKCAEGITKWLDKEPDFRTTGYIKEGT